MLTHIYKLSPKLPQMMVHVKVGVAHALAS